MLLLSQQRVVGRITQCLTHSRHSINANLVLLLLLQMGFKKRYSDFNKENKSFPGNTEYFEHLREGNGTLLQYSSLANPMDRGAWWAAVHGVAKSRTRLSDFTFTFHFHALEKEMATRSSVLAWRIPGVVEPGGLPSMGLHRVGHG